MGKPYQLDDQIGHLLRRAHQRASSIFLEAFGDADLTPTQWAALARLREHGTLSQNHLGRLTAMDPATVQGVIRRLVRRGLVERTPDAEDRRRTALCLSPEGAELVERLFGVGQHVSADTLAPLSTEERKAFLVALGKIS